MQGSLAINIKNIRTPKKKVSYRPSNESNPKLKQFPIPTMNSATLYHPNKIKPQVNINSKGKETQNPNPNIYTNIYLSNWGREYVCVCARARIVPQKEAKRVISGQPELFEPPKLPT